MLGWMILTLGPKSGAAEAVTAGRDAAPATPGTRTPTSKTATKAKPRSDADRMPLAGRVIANLPGRTRPGASDTSRLACTHHTIQSTAVLAGSHLTGHLASIPHQGRPTLAQQSADLLRQPPFRRRLGLDCCGHVGRLNCPRLRQPGEGPWAKSSDSQAARLDACASTDLTLHSSS